MIVIDRYILVIGGAIATRVLRGIVAGFLDREAARNILHLEAAVLAWCREVHEGHVPIVLDIKVIEYHSAHGAATAMGLHAYR